MARPPLTVICDFDGTITTADVGHAICERFAPGSLERVDARWMAGEITFHEAYRLACLELTAPVADMVAHALDVAVIREGFTDLVVACREHDARLVVASAGIDLYVEPILREHLGDLRDGIDVRANAAAVTLAGVEVTFPHLHPDCATCGNCKGLHARRARESGHVVIGVGDSHTDACLAQEADHVFARAWLAGHCETRIITHDPYEDFHPIARLVRDLGRRPAPPPPETA